MRFFIGFLYREVVSTADGYVQAIEVLAVKESTTLCNYIESNNWFHKQNLSSSTTLILWDCFASFLATPRSDASLPSARRGVGKQIGEDEPITGDHLTSADGDALTEHGAVVREGVKLAILAARIDRGW